jgi:hypothetical protein
MTLPDWLLPWLGTLAVMKVVGIVLAGGAFVWWRRTRRPRRGRLEED